MVKPCRPRQRIKESNLTQVLEQPTQFASIVREENDGIQNAFGRVLFLDRVWIAGESHVNSQSIRLGAVLGLTAVALTGPDLPAQQKPDKTKPALSNELNKRLPKWLSFSGVWKDSIQEGRKAIAWKA